ncbi:Na/Pi cotransporter family protein [Thermus thermamylovorans]|uniref:Na/Pi cotransporter family protein n=1 Tax=Thermus thermamylovorans TaxID=2509362 RepID=A0A4V2IV62_9DEIN|nr:Na/Pi cotransporter family protein [Thermus thermamylovorans]TBH21004.1 Na/Pi cotransporter family protein [Thermus thermamylovorans]
MGFLAGLALFLLGLELAYQGFARFRGRRHLLARALGRPGRTLVFGFLLGLFSGSGSGLSLLSLALLESRILSFALAGLLSLAATAGAALWVGVVALGPRGAAEALLALGMCLFLPPRTRPWGQVSLGLGLLLLGFGYMGEGAQGVVGLGLGGLSPGGYYLLGLALAFLLGSANGVAALALALAPSLPPAAPLALVLGGGVGTTGTLFLAGLLGRREALALGAALGVHRLLLSLLLFLLLPGLGGMGVLGVHLLSHLLYALAFLPLREGYARLAEGLFPGPRVAPKYLSLEALETPLLAQALVLRELGRVADAVREMLAKAVRILSQEEGGEAELSALEEKVDRLTREVVLYTAELSTRTGDERAVRLFVAASELEHLGDLVRRAVRQAEKLWAQGLTFSPEGKEDLLEAARRVLRRLEAMAAALTTGEKRLAQEVLREGPEAAFWDRLRRAHLLRLEGGRQESRATTLAHLDLLITLEEFSAGVERLCRLVLEL